MDYEVLSIPILLILFVFCVTVGICFSSYLNYKTQMKAIENQCEHVISPNNQIIWTNCKGPINQEIK